MEYGHTVPPFSTQDAKTEEVITDGHSKKDIGSFNTLENSAKAQISVNTTTGNRLL